MGLRCVTLFIFLCIAQLSHAQATPAYDTSFRYYYYDQKLSMFSESTVHKPAAVFFGDSITDGCEWSEFFPGKTVLNRGISGAGGWQASTAADLIRTRIKVKSLNFMRGRTFINKFLIIDEAQNLTPKQMKALITRAGPGTKVVCMGNIAQIDSPYLTEGSSGLTYVVDRFKGWAHGGHVTLQRGERSRLADFATEVL